MGKIIDCRLFLFGIAPLPRPVEETRMVVCQFDSFEIKLAFSLIRANVFEDKPSKVK